MTTVEIKITQSQLKKLLKDSKDGKNSDIGKTAIEAVKLYFRTVDRKVRFGPGAKGADIKVIRNGVAISYEVKGTQDSKIAFSKLKVSSRQCHDALVSGMQLIRVTNIRGRDLKLHFMKCGVDFTLEKEPRWAVKKIKAPKAQGKGARVGPTG